MNLAPRGPDGVKARIEEIRGRLESLRGGERPLAAAPSGVDAGDFSSLIASVNPSGPPGMGGFEPVNPLRGAIGMSLSPTGGLGREQISAMAAEAAARQGLDPKLFLSLVEQESAFNPRAVSSAGAQGLTQLMPGTARALGVTDPFDPLQSLDGGARYLAQMMREFGDPKLALAAYNAGPGAVRRHGGIPPFAETQAYVAKIMARSGLGG